MTCYYIKVETINSEQNLDENEVAKKYFGSFEGKRMILPSLYLPSKKLLEKHRSLMIG